MFVVSIPAHSLPSYVCRPLLCFLSVSKHIPYWDTQTLKIGFRDIVFIYEAPPNKSLPDYSGSTLCWGLGFTGIGVQGLGRLRKAFRVRACESLPCDLRQEPISGP